MTRRNLFALIAGLALAPWRTSRAVPVTWTVGTGDITAYSYVVYEGRASPDFIALLRAEWEKRYRGVW